MKPEKALKRAIRILKHDPVLLWCITNEALTQSIAEKDHPSYTADVKVVRDLAKRAIDG